MSWDDITAGDRDELLTDGPLTVTDFVRYQGASGDMNPIHHDSRYAQRAGFEQPFAVGMRQAGVLGTRLAERWGPGSIRVISIRFKSQAWPDEVLTYTTTVAGKRIENGERLVDLDLEVTRPDGTPHITGSATVSVDDDPR